jgi:hypothetical protein
VIKPALVDKGDYGGSAIMVVACWIGLRRRSDRKSVCSPRCSRVSWQSPVFFLFSQPPPSTSSFLLPRAGRRLRGGTFVLKTNTQGGRRWRAPRKSEVESGSQKWGLRIRKWEFRSRWGSPEGTTRIVGNLPVARVVPKWALRKV